MNISDFKFEKQFWKEAQLNDCDTLYSHIDCPLKILFHHYNDNTIGFRVDFNEEHLGDGYHVVSMEQRSDFVEDFIYHGKFVVFLSAKKGKRTI